MKILVLLIFLMSASSNASVLDPTPKSYSEVFVVSNECKGGARHDVWRYMRMPENVNAKFVGVSQEIITRQTDKNGIETSWDFVSNTLTIHLWADRGDCIDMPFFSTGTDSGIQVRVTLSVMLNDCAEYVEPPGSTKVIEAITQYQKAVGSLKCITTLRKTQHEQLIKKFNTKIKSAVNLKVDSETASVLGKQYKLRQVRQAIESYQQRVQALSPVYKRLVAEFDQNRKTIQAQRVSELTATLKRANAADVDGISNIIAELILYQRQTSSYDSKWLSKIEAVGSQIREVENECLDTLADYGDWMSAEKIGKPDSLSGPLAALALMSQSISERSKITLEKSLNLVQSLQARQGALLNAMATTEAKMTRMQADKLEASFRFLSEVQSESKDLAKLTESRSLYEAWIKANAFLRFEELCASIKNREWMKAGCVVAIADAEKAKIVLKSGLPRRIRDRQYSIPDKKIQDEIDTSLKNGDIKGAARLVDQGLDL
jgi:two-component sensor histidine kinase